MKNILFSLILIFPGIALAQQKDLTDTTEFRYGLPVSNDDTTRQVRTDEDPANQWVPVKANEIPKSLRQALEKHEVYDGWEQGQIYFDKSIDQYLVRIRQAKSIRTYGFSAEGASISFAEEDIVERDSIE